MTTTSDIRVTTTPEWEEYKDRPANWAFNVPETRYRTELARVIGVDNTKDRDDKPQKDIELSVPTLSRYAIHCYIDRKLVPELTAGEDEYGQTCYVTLNRGTLREGKDASLDYNYRWYLNGWNVDQAEVTQRPTEGSPRTTPAPTTTSSAGKSDDIDKLFDEVKSSPNEIPLWTKSVEHRIAWAQAVNLTKAYFNQHPLTDKEGTLLPTDDPLCQSEESYMSHLTYATICNGPDLDRWMPFIVDEPEEPATEAGEESQGDGLP